MANRYWVGGDGTWNSSNTVNWSATSGGAGGASAPTSVDSVFFDANSGTSRTTTIGGGAACLDINFTGAITPIITGSTTASVYGSATFISAMTFSAGGSASFNFLSTSTGKTITTNGVNFRNTSFSFQGVGGGWTFQDDFSCPTITHSNGSLDTNSKTVSVQNFTSNSGATRTLSLGNSVINVSGNWTFASTGLTFNVGTSTINMTGASKAFTNGSLTYYNVNFNGTGVTIAGDATYNIRTVSPGVTVNNTAGSNQTASSFVDNGTPALAITEQSTVAGTPYTLTKTSGAVIFRHCSIKDCTATGGATFNALESSTNISGNTGITFGVARTFMQIKPNGVYEALYFEDANGVMQNLTMHNSNAMRQLIINGGFAVNQRVVSGTVTLTAGAYGHDRWKAGAGGCTYTFATINNITTITITAGSLIQVIEGLNLYSGIYVLSWAGTAQGRVGNGNYSASSITTSIIGGNNLNVEFGIGTLSKVQFNAGDTALPFQPKTFSDELLSCQRYYEKSYSYLVMPTTNTSNAGMESRVAPSNTVAAGQAYGKISYKTKKRVASTITIYPYNVGTNTTCVTASGGNDLAPNSGGVAQSGDDGFTCYNATGGTLTLTTFNVSFHWTADAEL